MGSARRVPSLAEATWRKTKKKKKKKKKKKEKTRLERGKREGIQISQERSEVK